MAAKLQERELMWSVVTILRCLNSALMLHIFRTSASGALIRIQRAFHVMQTAEKTLVHTDSNMVSSLSGYQKVVCYLLEPFPIPFSTFLGIITAPSIPLYSLKF